MIVAAAAVAVVVVVLAATVAATAAAACVVVIVATVAVAALVASCGLRRVTTCRTNCRPLIGLGSSSSSGDSDVAVDDVDLVDCLCLQCTPCDRHKSVLFQ